MAQIPNVLAWLALAAALLAAGPDGQGATESGGGQPVAAEDIHGPLGPMPAPAGSGEGAGQSITPRRAAGAAVFGAFLLVGAYFVWRRRRSRESPDRPAARGPFPSESELLKLTDGPFYERLMGELRQAVGAHEGRPARVLTPRELQQALQSRLESSMEGRLRELRRHAETVLYAGGRAEDAARREDLATANDTLEGIRSVGGEEAG